MKKLTIIELINNNIAFTASDNTRQQKVDLLFENIEKTSVLIRNYSRIINPNYDVDDEIINFTLPEINGDLTASLSPLLIGQYKACASVLRSALELAIAALFFQLEQNLELNRNLQFNSSWKTWDNGKSDLPNWELILKTINENENLKAFEKLHNINIATEVNLLYKDLLCYSNNRVLDTNHQDILSIYMLQSDLREPTNLLFERFCILYENTISTILKTWVICFPELIITNDSNSENTDNTEVVHALLNTSNKNDIVQFCINKSKTK